MKEVKAVIGLGYGDEGKGAVSRYFSKIAIQSNNKTLNVLYNGGCQRGHTALGHVFHCFGSGAIDGADTYYTDQFMVNPIGWFFEYQELDQKPKLIIHPNARVTTPYDALINQLREEKRDEQRHGSCGIGILETRRRSEANGKSYLKAKDLLDEQLLYIKLAMIRDHYFPKRCEECGIEPKVEDEYMFDNFITCVHQMMSCGNVIIDDDQCSHFYEYDTYIFEGGQGLALSEDRTENYPYLTPSFTGSKGFVPFLTKLFIEDKKVDFNLETCYVTRSYATRHGAGPLPRECSKEDINPAIEDTTNMSNNWQGSLRFAPLVMENLEFWMKQDIQTYANWMSQYRIDPAFSMAITHLDYTDGKIYSCLGQRLGGTDRAMLRDFNGLKYRLPLFEQMKVYRFSGKDTLPVIELPWIGTLSWANKVVNE